MRPPTRKSVSVSEDCGARLFAYCAKSGVSASGLVEALLKPIMDGTMPVPVPCKHKDGAAQDPDLQERIRSAYIRGILSSIAEAAPDAGLSIIVRFPVSHALGQLIDDQIQRYTHDRDGKPLHQTASDILDGAINHMLDVLEKTPRSNFCALCTNQIDGSARLLPLGKDDGMVWVCYACDDEHPRKRRYSFVGGKAVDGRASSGTFIGGKDGNGNRHKSSRIG